MIKQLLAVVGLFLVALLPFILLGRRDKDTEPDDQPHVTWY